MKRRHFLGTAFAGAGPCLSQSPGAAPTGKLPARRRFFYNDDGDSSLFCYQGPFRREQVTDAADVLAGTPVTTLVLCVCYSDTFTYPSQVGVMQGWRKTRSHESGYYQRVYDFFQFVRRNNWDIPGMVKERAAGSGLEFIPSMRMNDAHFAQKEDPKEHPLTGKFWLEHQDLIINPQAKWPAFYNEFVLDFRHEKVRDFRLRTAFEIIDRYGDEGFEMDWTRHYQFFRKGQEQPELLTDMVRQARRRLDEKPRPDGGRKLLLVRVAASPEASLDCGLDVAKWIREGLIDVVVPSSPTRIISFDMPVKEWMQLTKGTQVQVHPSPDSASPRGDGLAHVEMYRAAASNCYAQGADGFYMFNLFAYRYPLPDEAYLILREVSHPRALDRRDKLFMATRENWRKDTDTLPVALKDRNAERPARIGMMIGEDLRNARVNSTLRKVLLRVRVDRIHPESRFLIGLDGSTLEPTGVYAPTAAEIEQGRKSMPDWTYEARMIKGPWIWMEVDLTSKPPGPGDHVISVWPDGRAAHEPLLTDVDVQVLYDFAGR